MFCSDDSWAYHICELCFFAKFPPLFSFDEQAEFWGVFNQSNWGSEGAMMGFPIMDNDELIGLGYHYDIIVDQLRYGLQLAFYLESEAAAQAAAGEVVAYRWRKDNMILSVWGLFDENGEWVYNDEIVDFFTQHYGEPIEPIE